MAGILAPDPKNYVVGRGFLLFKPEDAVDFYHLGNCPKFSITPKVEVLPHFSVMAGTKVQDFQVILQKGADLSIDMEEATANNLALFFQGDVDATDPANVQVDIFSKENSVNGQLRFYATNDTGPRWNFDLLSVLFNPTSAFSPISDSWNAMTVNASMLIVDGSWGTATLRPDIRTVAPENVVLPFITGPLNQGDSPTYAEIGEIMTVNIGGWVGVTRVAYQWFADAVAISGANGKTYTPVSGDVGAVLTARITASNLIGSTIALSAATAAVVS